MEAMHNDKKEIILKSCTGSGKTIILTHFIDTYMRSFGDTVFIWLTPGKGNLEEQSKEKMDRYIYGASTKLLCDVMTSGFSTGDTCFINWEKLTKKGNTALRDSEKTNFIEYIEKAFNIKTSFQDRYFYVIEHFIECFFTDFVIKKAFFPSFRVFFEIFHPDSCRFFHHFCARAFAIILSCTFFRNSGNRFFFL